MKKIVVILVVLLGNTALLQAQSLLTVTVRNVKTANGNILVAIYKDEASFLKTAWLGKVVESVKGETTVVFDSIPNGTFAVSVIHDENKNNKLDSNWVGMPKEGFGFGNDVTGTFGPPGFDKASFKKEAHPQKMMITLRYL